ncbi:MAG: tryptophan--tRNA ligase [Saprospiraceae bacterium]|nr:tryptophan--tRNA ligase [Saprospiraceae bacterium]MBK7787742.1 tryptophan--tRNA ligase [Saprospiraceae bacterium]MBK8109201.1 tryptophan--tRNA ligase [Saprospiraceae bacterium]MBK8850086.1 tryptophan--tRNA ligase [Saprospiraceae bacterium]MBK9687716.1 tryptophan--tRNA ligase [Saprospiraceae bacterium]
MKTVLSAIQPTGDIHLGNYFGAVANWVRLQQDYRCIYGVVDYHAMTMPYDPVKLRNNTWELIINLMAVGIKPENLFVQSLIPEHTELTWIFNCFCSYGQLTRMTQFKDKSSQLGEMSKDDFISVGLLDYPVLQAADILIYKADYVPVGKDQEQHLELSRDIAQRFNTQAKKEYFVLPEGLYTETPKIKSTADPSRKMSKSAGEKHYISLFAEETVVRKQIKSAVTDTGEASDAMSEGVANLFEMIKASGAIDVHNSLMGEYQKGSLKYAELKEATANVIVDLLQVFKNNKAAINEDKRAIKDQIKASSEQIRKRAQETIREVKELTGLLNVR